MHHQRPFILGTLAIAFLLTLPVLIQDGMFCDAYLYTSVAKNLAHGEGSFWFPYFDEMNVANLPSFHEQPPLVFWLESLFFRVFGDSMYTERIYTLLMMLLNMFLIKHIWQLVMPERKQFYWLAILCWITIPVCFWSFHNCMHENTMSVFCLSAIAASCNVYFKQSKNLLWLLLSGIFVVLAFLSKGLPGLYPLAIPVCLLLSGQLNFTQTTRDTMLLSIIPIGFAALVWFHPTLHKSIIDNYFILRLFQRVGHAPTVTNRFDTLIRLFTELIPVLSIGLLLYLISVKQRLNTLFFTDKKKVFFFLLLGLCGTLPLMLTSVQKGFYMVAALPCFGLAFGIWYSAFTEKWIDAFSVKYKATLNRTAYFLCILSVLLTVFFVGKTSRDHEILHDVYAIGQLVPSNTYFEVENKQFEDWSFQNYLMRYFHLGVRWKPSNYLVCEKNRKPSDHSRWERIPMETMRYDFYKLKVLSN